MRHSDNGSACSEVLRLPFESRCPSQCFSGKASACAGAYRQLRFRMCGRGRIASSIWQRLGSEEHRAPYSCNPSLLKGLEWRARRRTANLEAVQAVLHSCVTTDAYCGACRVTVCRVHLTWPSLPHSDQSPSLSHRRQSEGVGGKRSEHVHAMCVNVCLHVLKRACMRAATGDCTCVCVCALVHVSGVVCLCVVCVWASLCEVRVLA